MFGLFFLFFILVKILLLSVGYSLITWLVIELLVNTIRNSKGNKPITYNFRTFVKQVVIMCAFFITLMFMPFYDTQRNTLSVGNGYELYDSEEIGIYLQRVKSRGGVCMSCVDVVRVEAFALHGDLVIGRGNDYFVMNTATKEISQFTEVEDYTAYANSQDIVLPEKLENAHDAITKHCLWRSLLLP